MLFGPFWKPECVQTSIEKMDAFFEVKRGAVPIFWGRPGGMCRALGGIIGGYKDPKIAGESRTRAKEFLISVSSTPSRVGRRIAPRISLGRSYFDVGSFELCVG